MSLRVGELAKRVGLTVRTLHHYDHIGLLSPAARSASGFRLYGREDVVRLHRIQALKQLGCPLADIKAFLEKPGASIVAIVTEQMKDLEEQVRRANALHERLSLLRDQLARGEDAGLTDWLSILEMMTLYERHLSEEEIDTLFSKKAAVNLDKECREIIVLLQDLTARGVPPESRDAEALAWRWVRLWREATGNDAVLALKLKRIHREERTGVFEGVSPQLAEYLIRSIANARTTLFARHLTAAELEEVRARQAVRIFEWPPLIAGVQQQMNRGAVPDDPAVRLLARRWASLFRASYSGGDRKLEEKIRSAFRSEPDLLVAVGVDRSLIDFMERAVMNIRTDSPKDTGAPGVAPKPTALRVATLRAVHQLHDAPLIFEDPLALRVLGADEVEALRTDLERYDTPLLKGLRASVVVRSRFAEDEWELSRRRGVRQYVILGAGLDTFAYRNRQRDGGRVFEVDLPATQTWKRDRLRAAGIKEPASLTYVPVDFERKTLAEALGQEGFRREEPAFFSWLGVTMYLGEDAIADTLAFVASLAPGSAIAFDYAVSPALLSPRELKARELLTARAAQGDEPWKTSFDPQALAALLRALGFYEVEDFASPRLNELYFAGRGDGLRKGGGSRLVCARV